jgi:Streptomycin adenylyltransferase
MPLTITDDFRLGWQQRTIAAIQHLLEPEPHVLALLLVGSARTTPTDQWSDLDLLLIVEDAVFDRFFPSFTWLMPSEAVFAYEQYSDVQRGTTRLVLHDGRRLDLVIAARSCFLNHTDWPLWQGVQSLILRDTAIADHLATPFLPPSVAVPTDEAVRDGVAQFWFRTHMALVTCDRGDLLIAMHLWCSLAQDVCELAMQLRDRATGTTIHRTGREWNSLIRSIVPPTYPLSHHSLRPAILQIGQQFDELAVQLFSNYERHAATMQAYVQQAERWGAHQ